MMRSSETKQISVGGEDMHSSNRHTPGSSGAEDYHMNSGARSNPHISGGTGGPSHKPMKHLMKNADHGGHEIHEHSPNHGRHHHPGITGHHTGAGMPGAPFSGGLSSQDEAGESPQEEASESPAQEAAEEASEPDAASGMGGASDGY